MLLVPEGVLVVVVPIVQVGLEGMRLGTGRWRRARQLLLKAVEFAAGVIGALDIVVHGDPVRKVLLEALVRGGVGALLSGIQKAIGVGVAVDDIERLFLTIDHHLIVEPESGLVVPCV